MTPGDEQPEGWLRGQLKDTAHLIKDKVDPASVSPETPYIGLEHVEAHTMRLLGQGQAADVRSIKSVFQPGDVLYGKLRPYLNKVVRPDFNGICSTDFLVFGESSKLDRGFLAHYLNRLWVADQANHLSNGVELPRVNWESLSRLPICYPAGKAEQRSIVTQLERAASLRFSADSYLTSVRRAAYQLRQSLLIAACSGSLTAAWRETHTPGEDPDALLARIEASRRSKLGRRWRTITIEVEDLWELPSGWVWTTPEQLLKPGRSITYGVIKLGPQVSDGVPTLRSSDVRWLRINAEHIKRIAREVADSYQRTYLQGNEILVTVRGTLGGVAIVPSSMAGWNISREVACLPLVPDVCAPYFALAIADGRSQRWLSGVTKGVAYTGVNLEDLKRLPLPLPPVEEQQEIVRRVSKFLSTADVLLARIDGGSRAVKRTSQAILAKAFRGELLASEATSSE